jgi:uncharacterized membrane protein YtjA (UPF0391 family)
VVALIAAAVGFGGVAGVAMEGARLLFWIFIVLFVISLVEPCPPRLAPSVVARTLCHSGSADVMTRKLVCAKQFDPAMQRGASFRSSWSAGGGCRCIGWGTTNQDRCLISDFDMRQRILTGNGRALHARH